LASVVAFEACTRAQLSSIAASTLNSVWSCERRLLFIVISIACRTPKARIASTTVAMIGQIQICRLRKTPVRETVRPMLLDAQVMLGVRGPAWDFVPKNDLNQLILNSPHPSLAEILADNARPKAVAHPLRTPRGGPMQMLDSSKFLLCRAGATPGKINKERRRDSESGHQFQSLQ
jgi:hypothetical protein